MMAAALLAVSCLAIGTWLEPHTDKLATEIIARVRGETIPSSRLFRRLLPGRSLTISSSGSVGYPRMIFWTTSWWSTPETVTRKRSTWRGEVVSSDDPGAGNQIILTDGELLVRNRSDRYPSRYRIYIPSSLA